MESEKKNQLDNLLFSYNLTSIINFPVRVQNTYATAINNIFIDISQFESYTVTPILNGLSDHDAQLSLVIPICLYKNLKLSGKLISI